MKQRQECRNATLVEVVHIRRSCHKILAALGQQDLAPVTPAILNINHSLNEIERMIEGCRHGEFKGQDQTSRRLAVDSIPRQ
jgi:hypothetical protein